MLRAAVQEAKTFVHQEEDPRYHTSKSRWALEVAKVLSDNADIKQEESYSPEQLTEKFAAADAVLKQYPELMKRSAYNQPQPAVVAGGGSRRQILQYEAATGKRQLAARRAFNAALRRAQGRGM